MKLIQIKYALCLSEYCNFSQASKELYITQPTLSQQISLLEQELNVKLFVRHARGVSLTDAGEEFITYARRIVNEVNSLTESMNSYSLLSKGKVKIGLLFVFANIGIASYLADFQALNTDIEVITYINGSVKLIEMLKNREVDAIIFMSNENIKNDNTLKIIKLYESEIVLVLPPDHRLSMKNQINFNDLDGENVILPDKESTLYKPIMGFFHSANSIPRVVALNSNADISISCAVNGMGIGFVSKDIAKVYESKKIIIRPLIPTIKITVHYAVLKETLVIPSVKKLTSYFESFQI